MTVENLFHEACRSPLLPAGERRCGPRFEKEAVEALLPHRGSFLFVDGITHFARTPSPKALGDGEPAGTIACRLDLGRIAPELSGHFPGRPLWPGVLQVEAIGQAGLCLFRLLERNGLGEGEAGARRDYVLTDILAGRYLRPVAPRGEVEIVARVLRDGLFTVVVGQCLKDDLVCSAAAVRGVEKEVQE